MISPLKYLGVLGLFFSGSIYAQTFTNSQSVFSETWEKNDYARDIKVLNNGSRAVVGSRQNPTTNLHDGYLRIYKGNSQVYEVIFSGANNDELMGIDAISTSLTTSDIYVTGYFSGSMTVTRNYYGLPHNTTSVLYSRSAPSGNSLDATYFVAKFDQAGNAGWIQTAGQIGQTETEIGNDVVVKQVGTARYVYTTGFYRGTTTFSGNTGSFPRTATGMANDIFIAKYTDLGTTASLDWVNTGYSPFSLNHDYGYAIDADASGNVYVTGSVASSPASFTSVSTPIQTISTFGGDDAFVARYSLSGNCTGLTKLGGNTTALSTSPHDQGRGISVSGDGSQIYVSGYFTRYTGSGSFGTTPSAGGQEAFVVRLNNILSSVWYKTIHSTGADVGYRIKLSPNGQYCYLAGSYTGNLSVRNQLLGVDATLPAYNSATPNTDGFLLRCNTSGSGSQIWYAAGNDNVDVVAGVDLLLNDNVFICGSFKSYFLDFSGGLTYLINYIQNNPSQTTANFDAFFAEFSTGFAPKIASTDVNLTSTAASIYPNPASGTVTLRSETASAETPKQFMLLDLAGRVVLTEMVMQTQSQFRVDDLPAGTYIWRLSSASGDTQQGKLIVTE